LCFDFSENLLCWFSMNFSAFQSDWICSSGQNRCLKRLQHFNNDND
jgi:hypothetical protein